MYNNDFDPYDTLLEAMERIQRLEQAHNKLAHAFDKSERELNTALKALNHLQRSHMAAVKTIDILSTKILSPGK